MARRMPPVWVILKNGPSWPGLVFPEAWPDAAPSGYEFVYDRYGILKYANDGSPYITDGLQTISYYQYEANSTDPIPPTGKVFILRNGEYITRNGSYLVKAA